MTTKNMIDNLAKTMAIPETLVKSQQMKSLMVGATENLNPLAQQIVETVLDDLYGRKGFDGWWDNLDDEVTKEIHEVLARQVTQVLQSVKA